MRKLILVGLMVASIVFVSGCINEGKQFECKGCASGEILFESSTCNSFFNQLRQNETVKAFLDAYPRADACMETVCDPNSPPEPSGGCVVAYIVRFSYQDKELEVLVTEDQLDVLYPE